MEISYSMMTVEKRVYNKLWKIAFLLDFGFENFSNAVFFLVVKNSISLEIFLIEGCLRIFQKYLSNSTRNYSIIIYLLSYDY